MFVINLSRIAGALLCHSENTFSRLAAVVVTTTLTSVVYSAQTVAQEVVSPPANASGVLQLTRIDGDLGDVDLDGFLDETGWQQLLAGQLICGRLSLYCHAAVAKMSYV